MNLLCEKGDFIWKLYQGENKKKNEIKIRHGYGWQLFLNGYQYFGNWKNNKANGKGLLMFPDKSYFLGNFENNKIKSGKMIYEWGSEFCGNFDENQRFLKGEFILDVDYKLKITYDEKGEIYKAILINKNNEEEKYYIDFNNFKNDQRVFQDEKMFKLHIDREIIINKEGKIKLQIKKKKKFEGKIKISVIIDSSPFRYQKISQHAISNKTLFNKQVNFGLYVKQSQYSKCFFYNRLGFKIPSNIMTTNPFKNQKIEIPFLNNDYIFVEEGKYNQKTFLIIKGIYKENNSYDKINDDIIYIKNLNKISQNEKILKNKINFENLLINIWKKKSGIKLLTNKLLTTYFLKVNHIFDFYFEKTKKANIKPNNKNLVYDQTSEAIENNNIFGNFNKVNQIKTMNKNENLNRTDNNLINFNKEIIIEKKHSKKFCDNQNKPKFNTFGFSLFKNFIFRSKNKKKKKKRTKF